MGQYSYYQLNIDYIIETYCVNKDKPVLQCNGKCHLSKQLDLAYAASNHFDLEQCYMVNHTISLPSDKIGEFEKIILMFKSEIETLMKKYPSNQANQVIQINTSMLPLTDVLD